MSPNPVTTDRTVSVRLFKSDFLEYFSHIHPATPIVVFSPVVVYFLYQSIVFNAIFTMPLWVLGVLTWTLLEYCAHRFLFHYEFSSKLGKRIHFLLHGVHHDYPNDGTRLVMPLLVSAPLAISLYGLYRFIFGAYASGVFAGLVSGYICYDTMHYAVHHFAMKHPVLRFLKVYHLKHHFQNPDTAFGVSNPFWDYVFGTVPLAKPVIVPEVAYQPDRKAA